MTSFYKKHSHIFISIFSILALFAFFVLSKKDSNGFLNLFSFPSSGNIVNDPLLHSIAVIHNSSTLSKSEEKRQRAMKKLSDAINEVLLGRKKDEKIEHLELKLDRARALIKEAINQRSNISIEDGAQYVPHGNIYNNAFAFHRSYLLMEKIFKIYIYEEGEVPLFHNGPCKNIYSLEGIFVKSIENQNNKFRTRDPEEAHVYFLPFSVAMIIEHLFDPILRDKAVLERTIVDYVKVISLKYHYWNRSLGADHFMLSCHDWGPRATWYHPLLYFHSIRALCNANKSENYNPRKDVSIPEINLKTGELKTPIKGLHPSQRTILGFFAGRMHGRIRPALLNYWKEKDLDLHVYEQLPEQISYDDMMKKSKYCLCPSGFEVASPRIVEAMYAGCVPVLISQNYVLPFSDVLNWSSFSVQVLVSDIPNLKKILMGIPYQKYLEMQKGVEQVQQHFVINDPPKRFDVFHMIIHSIWLRRLNVHIYS
ncbi:probable glycosyltransferase At3g07620 [Amaranthus tricolor]|uniref:probable glycosyltransferase At3g07620 n=1 Tax=Amaranthus tricolor TaxID=29722 RepID=UPI002583A48A|nr:probable glycosyltransferase At3g07620 [Amaranthus tricolor]